MPLADPTIIRDATRLDAVHVTGLLDTPARPALDRLTRLTTRLLGVPTAVVTLVDRDRHYVASASGLSPAFEAARQTPLSHSFTQHVVASAAPLVVTDTALHPLVLGHLVIPELGVRACAGLPLVTADGRALGSLCAFDEAPREWSPEDLALLTDLAQAAMTEIELRSASRLLEEQSEQLRDLLDHTGELVCAFDANGLITYVNKAWTRTLLASFEESMVRGVSAILAPESRAAWKSAWKRMMDGVPTTDLELVFQPRGRAPVMAVCRLTPRVVEFDVRGARLVCRDVTERRRADRLKDEMIGVVSHELRTPIGAVKGALQLLGTLLPADLGERERGLLRLAARNSDRLLALVNDLLDLERLDDTDSVLADAAVTLQSVFDATRDSTAVVAEQADVALRFVATGARVRGDIARLTQVLVNLVGNAIKFTPAGFRVTVDAMEDGLMWRVRVQDEGPGIPADQLERIFDRFAQVQPRDASEKGGSGLGLAIARGIVQQHGGRIWAASIEGAGSMVSFTVPKTLD
jgi:PAS domain S-box-containing protein